jgi:VWFA-related protein
MKIFLTLALLTTTAALAQTPDANQPPADDLSQTASITVRSNLVLVPALVKTKSGQLVYTLTADDFTLTDDGVPQKLRLEDDSGSEPLALVIVAQTGGLGAAHLEDYRNLGTMLDNLVGNVDHKIAVVGFDSTPTLLHGFTPRTDFIVKSLNGLDPGDPGAAVLDALNFAVDQLRTQPPNYRRAILLLSETIDYGSKTSLVDALHSISDTNTAIYSIGFSTTKSQVGREASKFQSSEPGPQHGCFSRDLGTDADGNIIRPTESKASQDYNCIAMLAPPLRLAMMAFIATRNAMRRNISESVAQLTGGEFYKFKDVKTLNRDLFTISNHIPNHYTLSFHPTMPEPGFHQIVLRLKDRPGFSVEARNGYWFDGSAPAK